MMMKKMLEAAAFLAGFFVFATANSLLPGGIWTEIHNLMLPQFPNGCNVVRSGSKTQMEHPSIRGQLSYGDWTNIPGATWPWLGLEPPGPSRMCLLKRFLPQIAFFIPLHFCHLLSFQILSRLTLCSNGGCLSTWVERTGNSVLHHVLLYSKLSHCM